MKQRWMMIAAALVLVSCQFLTPTGKTPAPADTPPQPGPQASSTAAPTVTVSTPAATGPTAAPQTGPAPTTAPLASENELQPDYTRFGGSPPARWEPQGAAAAQPALPIDLGTVSNGGVIEGLTEAQRAALARDGFTVLALGDAQFADIREQVSDRYGQPYYLTTDAAYHALHVTFDETLKALERDALGPQVAEVTRAVLEQVLAYPSAGTPVAEDSELAAAYLAVALRLLDPQAELPADLETRIAPQMAQIEAAAGRDKSALIPNFEDDYGAYKPVSHYAEDPALEAYFRGMTWYGRVSFKFVDPQDPAYKPSRAPLIITLALREAEGAGEGWKSANELLNYLVGPSDDPGPAEISLLMDAVYGTDAQFIDLADETRWQAFLQRVDDLPAPQINSTFLETSMQQRAARDWRFLGQRFTFDGMIFQNLISDKVGSPDKQRKFPSGLDVMAVLGSAPALEALEAAGETAYQNYPEQMERLQKLAQAQPEAEWLGRFYTGWLYSFFPQLEAKDEAFPAYMRTGAWGYKELNSALGSWVELKHDTVLYAKMPEFMGGGGPPSSEPAPAYIEPNPEVFYRLSNIATELRFGLDFRVQAQYEGYQDQRALGLDRLIPSLGSLGDRLKALGDIAARELAGEALTQDDYNVIQSCLGAVECNDSAFPETPPVPLVAAVSGAEDQVLEVAVGKLDRIYVIVPIDNRLVAAQGGVFSYYEFIQPRSDRLTDQQWQARLEANPPARPAWTGNFLLPGGEARDALAMRAGDWYIITEEGGTPPLNVRREASRSTAVAGKLPAGEYFQVTEGPVTRGDETWWKIRVEFMNNLEGWVLWNQAWYERAHGQ